MKRIVLTLAVVVRVAAATALHAAPDDVESRTQSAPPNAGGLSKVQPHVNGDSSMPMTVEDVMNMNARLDRLGIMHPGLERWLEVSAAAGAIRFRTLALDGLSTDVNQAQSTEAFRGRVKVDAAGRYAVYGGAATGRGFNSGWNTTGIGTGTAGFELYLKELYAMARASSRLELSAGGLYLVRGESTEATGSSTTTQSPSSTGI